MPGSRFLPLSADGVLRRQLAAYLLARLPSGMLLLALLLFARSRLLSYGTAGIVVATYSVAVAVMAPALGRTVDRVGARKVIPAAAAAHLIGMVIAVSQHHVLPMAAGAALAGAALPPSPAALRAAWRTLPEQVRTMVFSVDGVVLEMVNVVGPLLVVALIALTQPAAALLTASILIAAGAAGATLTLPNTAPPPPQERHWLGPLRVRAVPVLLAMVSVSTGALAFIEVACVAYGTDRHQSSLGGVLLAVMSVGSMAGGIINAAHPGPLPLLSKLRWLFLLAAGGFAVLAIVSVTWVLAVVLLLANMAFAPLIASLFDLLGVAAPAEATTEAFTWASSANFAAVGLGNAAAGLVVSAAGTHTAFLGAALIMAAGAPLTLLRWLRPELPAPATAG